MKNHFTKRILPILAACFVLISLVFVPADLVSAKTSGDIQHIYDEAGLLTSSELNSLEDMCAQYSEKDDIDIVILTHKDPASVDGEIYIENFNDNKRYLDSVILLVDMYRGDVLVQGYGIAQSNINSSRASSIAENVASYLRDNNSFEAFKKYILSSDNYMNYVPLYFNPLLQLAVAVVIGALVVFIMAFNAGGKMTATGSTYLDTNHSGLIGRRDDYIRTQITRVRKPQNNNGGGKGGGISAGGLSHSSGRAKI